MKKKLKDNLNNLLFATACIIVILGVSGCTASIKPQIEGQIIEQKAEAKISEANLAKAEQDFADEAKKPSPDPVKLLQLDSKIAVFEMESLKNAALIKALQEKLKQVEQSEKELRDAAKQGAAYLPSPWREMALMGMTFGVALWRNRGVANARVNDTQVQADAILASVVTSVNEVLTPELKAQIKQGELTKAAVNKAQGRI